jgi:hypothetical protein
VSWLSHFSLFRTMQARNHLRDRFNVNWYNSTAGRLLWRKSCRKEEMTKMQRLVLLES